MTIRAIFFMAIIFLSALITFNFIGFLQPVNPFINRIFPDAPDKSCLNDSDCTLAIPSRLSECAICDPYGCKLYDDSSIEVVAINKNWQPRCVFSKPPGTCVAACTGGIQQKDYEPKCINGQCVKSKKET
jgi:hypothetical protein